MLVAKHQLTRNPHFHFHPLHTLFSLVAGVILFGLMAWLLAVPAR
jgi:predicted PurR-regulated permease PerM